MTMDLEQQSLLSASLREVLVGPGDALASQLADLGWDDVVADDPETASQLLHREHGRALTRSTLLDRQLLDRLPVSAGAVAWPTCGPWVLLGEPAPDATVLVPLDDRHLAVASAGDLSLCAADTFDRTDDYWLLTELVLPGQECEELPSALAAARRALASELIGVTEEVLRLAVEHTSTRRQFGAPIAAFQAVRHRLSEAHVALVGARSVLTAATDEGGAWSARVAKAAAGRAHERSALSAVQVCGAMGGSDEHPLHRYVSRGVLLDALLGGWAEEAAELGREVLETQELPVLTEI
jgi:hypothetical protein